MLSNAYFLAKFRFDTAENEPAKNLQKNILFLVLLISFAKFAKFAKLAKLAKFAKRHGEEIAVPCALILREGRGGALAAAAPAGRRGAARPAERLLGSW